MNMNMSIFSVLNKPASCIFVRLFLSVWVLGLALSIQAKEVFIYSFDVPAQALSSTLIELSEITRRDFVASARLINQVPAPSLSGDMSLEAALNTLLSETELDYVILDNASVVIKRRVKKLTIDAPRLEEVVVTSQKRVQLGQEIPMSVTSLNGDNLQKLGKTNTRDLFKVAPAVSYHGAISAAGQGLRIRGVGSAVIASGIEQSVGTVIDGVVTGPSGSGLQELWDVERVEVLRGPQGTLFGKNVSAGAVNLVSKDPTESLEAAITGRYEANTDGYRLDGVVSGPITDDLLYRVSGFGLNQNKGWVENLATAEQENRKKRSGGRLKLHYFHDNLWAKLAYAYDKLDDSCCARVFSSIDNLTDTPTNNTWLIPALERYQVPVGEDNRFSITEGNLFEQAVTQHTVLELGAQLSTGHRVKSITGYRTWQHNSVNDADNIDLMLASEVRDENNLSIRTQELQWLSPDNSDFEYILGLYYYDQHFPKQEVIGGGDFVSGNSGRTYVNSVVDIEHIAAFGHATWHINDEVSVFSGLRLLREEIQAVGQQAGDHWIWPTDYPVNQVADTDTDYVGTLGAQYHWLDDSLIYTSISRGYKGMAVGNSSNSIFFRAPIETEDGTMLTADSALLDPETVVNIELGSKNYFFDQRLQLNGTFFYSEFSDFQTSAFDGISGSFQLVNAGVVETKGVELEFKVLPWAGAELDGSVSWVQAIYKEFTGAPCQAQQIINGSCSNSQGAQDLSGQKLNQNPDWQFGVNFRQDIPLANKRAYFNLYYGWRDDVIIDADLDANTTQKAFGLLDVSVGYDMGMVDVSVFVKNATDTNYANRIIDAPFWQGAYQRYPAEGRTWGVEVSVVMN